MISFQSLDVARIKKGANRFQHENALLHISILENDTKYTDRNDIHVLNRKYNKYFILLITINSNDRPENYFL